MLDKNKTWKEEFAKFFEQPSRETLRNLLRSHLGESDEYDFKEDWISNQKLCRHVLALANFGGGCLIFGVRENQDKTFDPIGLNKIKDKTEIQKAIEKYIPTQLQYSILDLHYEDTEYNRIKGKMFQVLIVEDTPKYIPFVAKSDGDEIRKNTVYYRHLTSSVEANYEQLQVILNRRIETEYSTKGEFDLQNHLDQLKLLYGFIRPLIKYHHLEDTEDDYDQDPGYSIGGNPDYPRESFEQFVKNLVDMKKIFIRDMLLQ